MTSEKLFANTEVLAFACDIGSEVTGLCVSSRAAEKGMLFFALPGVAEGSRHGKDFAGDA